MIENLPIYFAGFFITAVVLSIVITKKVINVANILGIQDLPDKDRKIHTAARPKLGGLAIYLTFVFCVVVASFLNLTDEIPALKLGALILGGAVLIVGGILDDKYDLSPILQILFPLAAAAIMVFAGSHISYISNPFGGKIVLDQVKFLGLPVFGGLLIFVWIMGMTYTTKFLDGMDGLVTGISAIAALVIFGLSLRPEVSQTTTAILALVFAGAALGFLPFNFAPAKIFLGEGGSTIAGFLIGALAVISGGKIATALLVLGIPVLDAAWVILRRLFSRTSPFVGDKKHLHFRLLDAGLSQRQAVLFLYLLSALFGGIAVFLQSFGKLVALAVLFAVMMIVALTLVMLYRKRTDGNTNN